MVHLAELRKEWSDKPRKNFVFQIRVVVVHHSQKKLCVSIQQLYNLGCEINGLSERIKVIRSGSEPMCVGAGEEAVVSHTLALDS